MPVPCRQAAFLFSRDIAEGAMARVSPRAVFRDIELRAFRTVLGDSFEEVVPLLEQPVRYFRNGEKSKETYHERARRHVEAADKLERQCRHVLKTLVEADPLTREAVSWKAIRGKLVTCSSTGEYLKDAPKLADATAYKPFSDGSLFDLASPPWASGEDVRVALESLMSDIQAWRALASRLAPRARGPQNRDRQRSNLWVGEVLKQAGHKLDTSRNGLLAFVIRRVNRATGRPTPRDIFRDLKYVCDHLQTNDPA